MLQKCYKSVTKVLQKCYKSVTKVSHKFCQRCYKSVAKLFKSVAKGVIKVLQKCCQIVGVSQNKKECSSSQLTGPQQGSCLQICRLVADVV